MTSILDTARLNRANLMTDIEKLDWFIAFSQDLLMHGIELPDPAFDERARPGAGSPDRSHQSGSNVVWLKDMAQTDG